ncbi:MAG: hypothetical protein ACR2HA_03880 [Nocardioides sp.]
MSTLGGGRNACAGADVDAEVRELRDMIRRETLAGATAFVTHLADSGGLRTGVDVEQGADVCWALVNSLLLQLLVDTRAWSLQECGEWLVLAVSATLVDAGGDSGPRPLPSVDVRDDPKRERL